MKQYVIDELRIGDYEKIRAYLDMNFGHPVIGGIYWIPLDEEIHSNIQKEHGECSPFYFAVELDSEHMRMACELLIRTKSRVSCACMAYADENQRNWLVRHIDNILETLDINI